MDVALMLSAIFISRKQGGGESLWSMRAGANGRAKPDAWLRFHSDVDEPRIPFGRDQEARKPARDVVR
jgi:hypothetical protein